MARFVELQRFPRPTERQDGAAPTDIVRTACVRKQGHGPNRELVFPQVTPKVTSLEISPPPTKALAACCIQSHAITVKREPQPRYAEARPVEDSVPLRFEPDRGETSRELASNREEGMPLAENEHVVHVSKVAAGSIPSHDPVIDRVQHEIAQILARQRPDGQPTSWSGLVRIQENIEQSQETPFRKAPSKGSAKRFMSDRIVELGHVKLEEPGSAGKPSRGSTDRCMVPETFATGVGVVDGPELERRSGRSDQRMVNDAIPEGGRANGAGLGVANLEAGVVVEPKATGPQIIR